MKRKTCISSDVVYADDIMNLSDRTRLLYYDLNLCADGEGFFTNVKMALNISGAKPKNLRELIDIGYVIDFDTGVYAITHWWVHNKHDAKGYGPTTHIEEKAKVIEDEKSRVYIYNPSGIRQESDPNINNITNNKELNKPTNKSGSDGLPDDSIVSSLSNNDKVQLRLKCQEHNCDMDALIRYVDNSIRNRKEQTEIRNPYKYIVQIGEGIGWNPEEGNNSYIPKHTPKDGFIRYGDIEGSIWDNLSDREKERIKYHYPKEGDVERAIKYTDSVIAKNPDKEFEGNCADLIMNIVNHSWGVVSLKRD